MYTDKIDLLAAARELDEILQLDFPSMEAIQENDWNAKPYPDKWSKKEILGHLIDSACSNHRRFIMSQYGDQGIILYDQDQWVHLNHYQKLPADQLLQFWYNYNQHIANIGRMIPAENYKSKVYYNDGEVLTLEFVYSDYVAHLKHHLDQILEIK